MIERLAAFAPTFAPETGASRKSHPIARIAFRECTVPRETRAPVDHGLAGRQTFGHATRSEQNGSPSGLSGTMMRWSAHAQPPAALPHATMPSLATSPGTPLRE